MVAVTVTRAGHVRLYATMIGLLAGYAAAIATGEVDAAFLDQLRDLPWVGLPAAPRFELSVSPLLIVPFLIATVASNTKWAGLAMSTQNTTDVHWKRTARGWIRGGIVGGSLGNVSHGLHR